MSSLKDRLNELGANGSVDVARFVSAPSDSGRGGNKTNPADKTERKVSLG